MGFPKTATTPDGAETPRRKENERGGRGNEAPMRKKNE
jgi:hypothetical protein